jgi:2-amino-4-hydroxy-6-hydroxymethyldihydropteridine diphosphokinase
MVICYIALGSNTGKRADFIKLALECLEKDPAINVLKASSLIETEPENLLPQPKFLNSAAKLETRYSARELLEKLQEIEVKLGREAPHPKNQPRTIDLDILLFGDLKIDEDDLKIPHPRMWQREFVTAPLREIAPELF